FGRPDPGLAVHGEHVDADEDRQRHQAEPLTPSTRGEVRAEGGLLLRRVLRRRLRHGGYSVETTGSPLPTSSLIAGRSPGEARLAHLTRDGYSRTPEKTASLPRSSTSRSTSGAAVTIAWKASKSASTSPSVWPLTLSVIIDAEAFEIAQPDPWKPTSSIRSP